MTATQQRAVMRVVVTGAQGFLGSAVVARARELGHQVLGLGRRQPRPSDHPYCQLDLHDQTELRACLERVGAHAVVHAAGAPHHASEARQLVDNVAATASLFAANRRRPRPARVVLVSSAAVYGDAGEAPWAETLPLAPLSAYGRSKVAAEQVASEAGGDVTIARVFNLCGPGQDEHHVCGALARRIARVCRGEAREFVVGPRHPVRDYLDVRDAADALLHIAGAGSVPGVVNVGSGHGTAVSELADLMVALAGLPFAPPQRTSDGAAGVARSVADVGRLCALGWRPRRSLRESLAEQLRACVESSA